jgi:hypothetical protein
MVNLTAFLKTSNYPSLLVRKTPDLFGEKRRDEAKKRTVFISSFKIN